MGVKKMEKYSEISEDDLKRETEKVQKLTDKFTDEVDKLFKEKEKQIMENLRNRDSRATTR